MKRIKHTLRLLDYYSTAGVPTADAAQLTKKQKIRLPFRLVEDLIRGDYDNRLNRLLDHLAAAVTDREAVLYIYQMEDNLQKKKLVLNRHKPGRSYSRDFLRIEEKAPGRAALLKEVLREEARLRNLPDDLELQLTHCHLFRHRFPFRTPRQRKKLLQLGKPGFEKQLLEYGRTLAAASQLWQNKIRFDWRVFTGAGCSESDFADSIDPRIHWLRILELPESAEKEQIRRQYKKLARLRHPDTGGTITEMQLLNEAYRSLMDS